MVSFWCVVVMVMAIWVEAAGAIIMDGAEDADITTDGAAGVTAVGGKTPLLASHRFEVCFEYHRSPRTFYSMGG